MTESILHTEARRYVEELLSKGFILSKKRLRFNDIVEVGLFYGRLGEAFNTSLAILGVREACEACVKGGVMEIEGGSLLQMIQPWMITCADPRVKAGANTPAPATRPRPHQRSLK